MIPHDIEISVVFREGDFARLAVVEWESILQNKDILSEVYKRLANNQSAKDLLDWRAKKDIEFNGDKLVKSVEDFARTLTIPELIKENEDILNEYTKQPNCNKSDNP